MNVENSHIDHFSYEVPEGHEKRFKEKLNLHFPEKRNTHPLLKIAAVLIPILFILGYFTLNPVFTEKEKPLDILATYAPELFEAQCYMNHQIQLKQNELTQLQNPQNEVYLQKTFNELTRLREDYQLLLEDFKLSNGNNQLQIFILSNLNLQMELIENTLSEIEPQPHS